MDIFVVAAILGAVGTLLMIISSVRYNDQEIEYRLPRLFHATVSRRAAHLIVVTGSFILVLLVVFVAVGPLHPRETTVYAVSEFIQSRRFASTLLGLLFGIFLLFWIRQLLALKENEPLTWVHRGEAIFLVLLLALGGFSDQLTSFLNRVTQFSAGGLTLTLETLKRQGGLDRGQQGHGGAVPGHGQSLTALAFLSSVHGDEGMLSRDDRYVQGARSATPDPQDAFFRETIGETASCLNGVLAQTHDDEDVNIYVRRLRPILHEILVARRLDQNRVEATAQAFVDVSIDLLQELARTYFRPNNDYRGAVVDACRHLIVLRCPGAEPVVPPKDANADTAPLLAAIDRCANERAKASARLVTTMQAALATDSLFDRPYLSLLYASVLWRLEDYDGAVNTIEAWLALPAHKSDTGAAGLFYTIRMRTSLSVIMEDWIRSTENPPPLLLVHHLANIDQALDLMLAQPIVTTAWKAFNQTPYDVVSEGFKKPIWGTVCSLSPDQIRLATALLQEHMVYVYRATQHPEYFDRYAPQVVARREFMMRLDLACLKHASPPATDLFYAEILQIYAEVEIADAVRIAKLPDADAARRRFRNALDSATLGYSIVADHARDEEERARVGIVRDQKATELKYLLLQVQARAREALGQQG